MENTLETENVSDDVYITDCEKEETVEELMVGMIFDNEEEAFMYFAKYAKINGFAIAKRSSKVVDGVLRNLTLECSRGGKARVRTKNPIKPRPQTKIECPTRLNFIRNTDGKLRLSRVNLEHNHDHSPGKYKFYKSNRVLNENVKRALQLNDMAGIRVNKTYEALQIRARGHDNLPFSERDLRNYLDGLRRLKLKEGDAQAMFSYFMEMIADNSDFFYAMDVSEDGRLMNVFWADARSRAACKEFGDVVTFDITYVTNKYHMPFAPFVDVNHHGQSILLGCGLLSHEDTETFAWLFRTWKTCMGGYELPAIITDQCMAMKNAIEEVFPNTRHRWCIWHIMKKVPEKFAKFEKYASISICLQDIVFGSLSIEEFEVQWKSFVMEYGLEENNWLNRLYEERSRWVPVFLKDVFWAGMQSTQRSESINSYFDGYINHRTTLKRFVEQYANALGRKVANEKNEDIASSQSFIPTVIQDELEKQFQSVYTNAKAKEFQDQFVGKLRCTLHEKRDENTFENNFLKFEIFDTIIYGEVKRKKYVSFLVEFNSETNETKCNYRLFESRGIVCRHQLMVWGHMRVERAPDKYVLRRWRKDVTRVHSKVRIKYANNSNTIETKRRNYFYNEVDELVDLIEGSEENFVETISLIRELKLKFRKCSISSGSSTSKNPFSIEDDVIPAKESTIILDPIGIRKKGKPSNQRKQGIVEKIIKKKKEALKKKNKKNRMQETPESVPNTNAGWDSSYTGPFLWPNLMTPNIQQFETISFSLNGWSGDSVLANNHVWSEQLDDMPSSSRVADEEI